MKNIRETMRQAAMVAELVTDPNAAEKLTAREAAIREAIHVNRCKEGCACRENDE